MLGKEPRPSAKTPEGELRDGIIGEFVSQLSREEALLLGAKLNIVGKETAGGAVDSGKLADVLEEDSSALENLLPELRAEEGETAKDLVRKIEAILGVKASESSQK